jgi:hypothetical protein
LIKQTAISESNWDDHPDAWEILLKCPSGMELKEMVRARSTRTVGAAMSSKRLIGIVTGLLRIYAHPFHVIGLMLR